MIEQFKLEGFICPDVGCGGKLKLEEKNNTFKCLSCGGEVADYEEWVRKVDEAGRRSIDRFAKKIYSSIKRR